MFVWVYRLATWATTEQTQKKAQIASTATWASVSSRNRQGEEGSPERGSLWDEQKVLP